MIYAMMIACIPSLQFHSHRTKGRECCKGWEYRRWTRLLASSPTIVKAAPSEISESSSLLFNSPQTQTHCWSTHRSTKMLRGPSWSLYSRPLNESLWSLARGPERKPWFVPADLLYNVAMSTKLWSMLSLKSHTLKWNTSSPAGCVSSKVLDRIH